MKSIVYLLIVFVLASCSSHSTQSKNEIDKQLKSLNFFEAKRELETSKTKLLKQDYLYFSGIINNAFNKNAESLNNFQELLEDYGPKLSDSLKAKVLQTQLNLYLKIFEYKKGSLVGEELIKHYSKVLKPSILNDIRNTLDICRILKQIPNQIITKNEDDVVVLPIVRDKANLQRIPVRISNIEKNMIFDSGANLSLMSDSFAKKVGVTKLKGTINVGTGTDDVKVSLGVVKSMYLGSILFENIIFLIFPDAMLYSAEIDYSMDAIIGYPVMSQLGEFTIDNINNQFIIPIEPELTGVSNFALNELNLLVLATHKNDSLLFHFDSGSDRTSLFNRYYLKHKSEIDNLQLKTEQINLQGAGSTKQIDSYSIPDFDIQFTSKKIHFNSIDLYLEEVSEYDGRIGQDIISNMKKLTMNFDKMIIKVE
ncbi:retropepsin-like aspartic protease [Ancylomarina sp. 16SWW S1-10-2]|uniref:retropepsin-like aspartic protease n=1 Tax=Ancylomarina sp. 16SWW S1-10-2 TaxID=2499681 RepID=UPI0012AE124E|nr:retropepsin-like aspartic protease [Ancylomarina sp. 16SWW S1-10-2]MRT92738.1 hypothetical protein [Ancylomarina sp. 16SWW S1-10-2]